MSDKAGMEDKVRQQYQIRIKLASEENQLRAQWDSVMTQTRQLSVCIEEMAKREKKKKRVNWRQLPEESADETV